MKQLAFTLSLSSILISGSAFAGGFDNSGQPTGFFFDKENAVNLKISHTSPDWSGKDVDALTSGTLHPETETGNVVPAYTNIQFSARMALNDKASCTLQKDDPYRVLTSYKDDEHSYTIPNGAGAGSNLDTVAPLESKIESTAYSAGCSYRLAAGSGNMILLAGAKYQSFSGAFSSDGPILSTLFSGLSGEDDNWGVELDGGNELGYFVGFGYEMPEIALKANVSYHSAIDYDLTGTSTYSAAAANTFTALGGGTPSAAATVELDATASVQTPSAFNIGLQSGVAEGWLVFADIRIAKWSDVPEIKVTDGLADPGLSLFDQDTLAYTVGVGHQLTEKVTLGAAVSDGFDLGEDPSDPLEDGIDGDDLRQPQGNSMTYALAAGYKVSDDLSIGTNLAYTSLDATVIKDHSAESPGNQVEFDQSQAITGVMSLTYKF